MSTFRSSVTRDLAIANEHLADNPPCGGCGQPTYRSELRLYGQCKRCNDAYCAKAASRPISRLEAVQKLKALALAMRGGVSSANSRERTASRLLAAEAGGARLNPAQRWVLKCCEGRSGLPEVAP